MGNICCGHLRPETDPEVEAAKAEPMAETHQAIGKLLDAKMAEFQSDGMAGPGDVTVTQMPTSAGVMNGSGNDMFLDNGVAFQNSKKGLLQQQQQNRGLHHKSAATSQQSSNQSSSSSQVMSATSSTHSASASSLLSKRSQLMTQSMSASEMNVKQQAAAAVAASTTTTNSSSTASSTTSSFAETNRSAASTNFARSMSLGGATATTGNLCGPPLRQPGMPQRVFSVERPIISEEEPLVQMPDDDECDGTASGPLATIVPPAGGGFVAAAAAAASTLAAAAAAASSSGSEVKFSEQKQQQTSSSSKMQMSSDGAFVAETMESMNRSGQRRMTAGDVTVEQRRNESAVKGALQTESFSAQKSAAVLKEQFQIQTGEMTQQEQRSVASASVKVQADNFMAEKAVAKQAEMQTISSHGVTHQETHVASSTSSKFSTFTSKGVSSSTSSLMQCQLGANKLLPSIEYDPEWKATVRALDTTDLETMTAESTPEEVGRAVARYTQLLGRCVERLRALGVGEEEASDTLNAVDRVIRRSWAVPTHGHAIASSLCNAMRTNAGIDQLILNCARSASAHVQYLSVRVLEQCLTTENRAHVVETGLDPVVRAARSCSIMRASLDHMRAGTGVLEHLFKHSEATCTQVIRLGGLDALVSTLKEGDMETLRHCAGALANLSLYGGAENHLRMVQKRVPEWLFPLAMHEDDNIKYYACLAVATLVANKEIEAHVLRSATLALVEPFIQGHSPGEFASSCVAHSHGQSRDWLQRLVPVLLSKPKEGHTLAAFHFAMEAGIKKKQGNTRIFHEIGAIEPLKKVASCPNALASRLAAQALRLIGEEIPHKLSQQVPLWTEEDVNEWLKQIGFAQYAPQFVCSRVDGDILLQLTEHMLLDDIGITNGILRKRFMRELGSLKKMTDYSSCDASMLNSFLSSIGSDMTQYTYPLLNTGVDKDMLRYLTDEQLLRDCTIDNSIHRLRILDGIRAMSAPANPCDVSVKNLDVFISYRRSNGSQLASLLKVHLELKGFTVFIDVERLEAGKFDNNLLQSIRQAKHFILVLTPNALERCIGDEESKDWVHREIVGALESQCNIIPITDNFQWPDPEQLPEDMRAVSYFNGVRWIHDYQDACVDKLERFLKGDTKGGDAGHPGRYANLGGGGTPGTPSTVHGRQGPYVRSHSNESKGSVGSDKESAAAATNGQAVLVNGPSAIAVE